MSSLLSAVPTCIYFEFLEFGPFRYIIPNSASYFRYIDDILFIQLQDININSIIDRLDNVEPSMRFTCELKSNCTTFLGCLAYKE